MSANSIFLLPLSGPFFLNMNNRNMLHRFRGKRLFSQKSEDFLKNTLCPMTCYDSNDSLTSPELVWNLSIQFRCLRGVINDRRQNFTWMQLDRPSINQSKRVKTYKFNHITYFEHEGSAGCQSLTQTRCSCYQ